VAALILGEATAADMPGLWEVRYAVTENTLTLGRISDEELRASIEDTGRGWVVEQAGFIPGFAIGLAENGNVWALFARPEAQGQGIGSALHDAMIEWFATQPVPVLWLTTGADTKARRFYEAHGWRCVGDAGKGEVRYERPNPG
jgi:GNAT superfamily N-acetyltransferase